MRSRCTACRLRGVLSRRAMRKARVRYARPAQGSRCLLLGLERSEERPEFESFQTLQIINQWLHVGRVHGHSCHVITWLRTLWVRDPAAKISGRVGYGVGCDAQPAAEVGQVRSILARGIGAA